MSRKISADVRETAIEEADEFWEWAVVSSDGDIEYALDEGDADAMCRVRQDMLDYRKSRRIPAPLGAG